MKFFRQSTLIAIVVTAAAAIVAIDTPWLPAARIAFVVAVLTYIVAAVVQSILRSSRREQRRHVAQETVRRAHVVVVNDGRIEARHPDGDLLGWVNTATGRIVLIDEDRDDIEQVLTDEYTAFQKSA